MAQETHTTTVLITKQHADWISEKDINFSKFVRRACDEGIAKDVAMRSLEDTNDS